MSENQTSSVELKYPIPAIPLTFGGQGKSRDLFETSDPTLMLFHASDRVSTHNVVHESQIPRKGEVLTALTIFMLNHLEREGFSHHMTRFGRRIYDVIGNEGEFPANFHHRAIVAKRHRVVPVEFIWRNRLAGSIHRDFYSQGKENPYGVALPPGLPLMHKFLEPIFTPTEKSDVDDPMNAEVVKTLYRAAYELTRRAFVRGSVLLKQSGVELVDSKFEVGLDEKDRVCLIDEVLTPDSSRFSPQDEIKLGQEPPWLDKEPVRQVAMKMWAGGKKVPLTFCDEDTQQFSATYLDVFEKITGYSLADYQRGFLD